MGPEAILYIEPVEELTFMDYLNRPVIELMRHQDYSSEAMNNAMLVSSMTSAQLEGLNLGGNDNG